MLSLEECKVYLGSDWSDDRLEAVRDAIYNLAENTLDKHLFGGSVSINGHEKENKSNKTDRPNILSSIVRQTEK